MITIPPGITVDLDVEAGKALYAKGKKWLEGDGRVKGIHASDLLMPRLAFWRILDPKPNSEREVGLFLVGKLLHAFVLHEQGRAIDLGKTDEGQLFDEEIGLWYSPDRLDANGNPVEFKTSRALYEQRTVGDLATYIRQLLVYMAVRRSTTGTLWVLFINAKDASGKTAPAFRVYRVKVSAEELEAVRLDVRNQRNVLADALQAKNHEVLPLCPPWACHPEQCQWWAKCKPEGRYENMAYIKGRRKD